MRSASRRQSGFTLPELLVAGVFLLVCVGVMLLMVRPANYEPERRNAVRRLDLAVMMTAIANYKKHEGKLPPSITIQEKPIATTEDDSRNLCDDLVPKYAKDLPHDPTQSFKIIEDTTCAEPDQFYVSGYTVRVDETGRVILAAPAAENGEKITLERWFPYL